MASISEGGLLSRLDERIERLFVWVDSTESSRLMIVLFLANILAILPMILGYVVHPEPSHEMNTDLEIFRDRAGTILDGQLLYRDTDNVTLTPPVINYLLTPPMLLGDSVIIWQLWFSLFSFFTSAIIMLTITSLSSKRMGFSAALFYQCSPFAIYTSTAMVQDDTILPLILVMILLLIMKRLWQKAALFAGIGTMTKLFPALISPIIFFAADGRKEKLKVISTGFGIAIFICMPFLFLAGDDFIPFLEFYLLGKEPVELTGLEEDITIARGMSVWAYLSGIGLVVPTILLHGTFILSILAIWFFVWKEEVDVIKGFTLCILSIFVLYSKLHYGYHLMLLVALIPWSMHDYRRIMGLFIAALAARIVHLGWRGYLDLPGGYLLPLLLSIGLWVYWIWWVVVLLKGKRFDAQWKRDCDQKIPRISLISSLSFIFIILIQRVLLPL